MRRTLPVLGALWLLAGCEPVDAPLARYHLEQKVWDAQFYQRRIKISFLRASRNDMRLAITAFEEALRTDPLADARAASWDEAVVGDIRNIQVESRIALAYLYFLSERYSAAGTLYQETLAAADLSLDASLEARLGAARSLYLSGETSPVMELCGEIFRELSANPVFQSGERTIDPAFMNVPVALVRMHDEAGDSARTREFAGLALSFYDRTAADTTSYEDTALDARLGALQVCLVVRDWAAAVGRLDAILADESLPEEARPGLELLLGEIYAFPLGDAARATMILEAVSRRYAGTDYGYAARYDLGALQLQAGNTATAETILQELERDNQAPASVASRAMLARARALERAGRWDDAYTLYRRVEQLYPHTLAAIEAPLIVTRHFASTGESVLARRTIERAREYYLSLLDRGGAFAGDRLMVQAALAEAYVAAGEASGVAELLGSGSPSWDETSSAAGMLKSAEIYVTVLGDRGAAAEMLKKCIERFPETRYASVAQRRLDELGDRTP